MNELREQKTTLLTITHDLKEALKADRVIVLCEGSVLASGKPRHILTQSEVLKKAKLALLEPLDLMERMKEQKMSTAEWEAKLWQFALTL
jgi:energy-coupling factor transport system ATP-binding protein